MGGEGGSGTQFPLTEQVRKHGSVLRNSSYSLACAIFVCALEASQVLIIRSSGSVSKRHFYLLVLPFTPKCYIFDAKSS